MKVELTESEQELQVELAALRQEWTDRFFTGNEQPNAEFEKKVAGVAYKLHTALKERGRIPMHHPQLVKNRTEYEGIEDSAWFYEHAHCVDSLLEWIEDDTCNIQPTIGTKFPVDIYTNRWGHTDQYTFERTKDGWKVGSFGEPEDDKESEHRWCKGLIKRLEHDGVDYPSGIDMWLGEIWQRAKREGLEYDVVHTELRKLADWISATEQSNPFREERR